jgi:hypothetical protein
MQEPEGQFTDIKSNDIEACRRRLAALAEPVTVKRMWAGRSHRHAIVVRLVTRDDRNVADVRLWIVDSAGCLQPSDHGFTLDLHKLPELAAALVAAHRKAIELHLVERGRER